MIEPFLPGRVLWLAAALISILPAAAQQSSSAPAQATPQRPTFTSDTSTTAAGTLEIEFGATGTSSFGGFFALPSTIKFTPDAGGLFRQAEFSLSFDAIRSIAGGAGRDTRFGDTLGLAVRRPVYQGRSFSFAVAPRATFFLRGDRGARLGATALAAYGFGQNTLVANFTWTTATAPSPTNPAQQYDFAFDYARTLGETGWRGRTAVFAGLLAEKPKHRDAAISLGQGISYRVRPNLVLDFAVRQRGLAAGPRGYELLTGLTYNFGRLF